MKIGYDINNESYDKDSDSYTSTQQIQGVTNPEFMPPMVRTVYNLRPRKQTDYLKEYIDRSMFFSQVDNDIIKDKLSFLRYKGMKIYEETIDYATVIVYSFT